MGRSTFGRWFVFAGANPEAAKTVAIRPTRYVVSAYLTGSMLFGLATTTALGGPTLSRSSLVVVGGTALRGVKGMTAGQGTDPTHSGRRRLPPGFDRLGHTHGH